jgi:rubrerythrin
MLDDLDGSTRTADTSEAGRVAAGERGLGEYRCGLCGYGVMTLSVLPVCPMCHGSTWMLVRDGPFTPR